ncbi:MAG: ribosome maturation factor RimM [Oscillospiraceae bacterium]
MKKYLEIGQIVTTQGIKGEVRVKPWSDSPDFLCEFDTLYFDNGKIPVKIKYAKPHGNIVIMKIDKIDDINQAQTLRNKILFMDRDDVKLDDGVYFIQDLIGLTVVDAQDQSKIYGKIIDVTQTGANDVYYIEDETHNVVLIPAIKDVIEKTDLKAGLLHIHPLRGLFDDEN